MRESGAPYDETGEPNTRYTVPGERSGYLLRLPAGLFLNGWIHVLEDSELSLLLMIATLHGRYGHDRQVYLDGETRLLQFGIGRDTYQAHHLLERFGPSTWRLTQTATVSATARSEASPRAPRPNRTASGCSPKASTSQPSQPCAPRLSTGLAASVRGARAKVASPS
ncbi:hypothetical protein GA0070607_3156 [Micromonospora coriariae]|uniref:Uncharacterized protein n=1 Tax=Micromonospora coriariae TaxID=285665 RepID=A0A1C4W5H2_9ACTN|nr:hypothetical protein GA0070607_3156 [Micromonospora coriariae]